MFKYTSEPFKAASAKALGQLTSLSVPGFAGIRDSARDAPGSVGNAERTEEKSVFSFFPDGVFLACVRKN